MARDFFSCILHFVTVLAHFCGCIVIGFEVIYRIDSPDCGNLSPALMLLQTIDLRHYGVSVGNNKSFMFKVKAKKEIAIYATDTINTSIAENYYCLYIGGDFNQWSKIRLKREGKILDKKIEYGTHVHANGSEYNPFWFHWGNGDIRGGFGNTVGTQTFIEWNDLDAFDVKGLGIATCWGSTGSWIFKVDVEDESIGYFSKCNTTDSRAGLPISDQMLTSKSVCTAMCAFIKKCFGFNYHDHERRCQLLSVGAEPLTNIHRTLFTGWNFYAKCYTRKDVCVGCFF